MTFCPEPDPPKWYEKIWIVRKILSRLRLRRLKRMTFPLAMNVAPRSIADDIISVTPMLHPPDNWKITPIYGNDARNDINI